MIFKDTSVVSAPIDSEDDDGEKKEIFKMFT